MGLERRRSEQRALRQRQHIAEFVLADGTRGVPCHRPEGAADQGHWHVPHHQGQWHHRRGGRARQSRRGRSVRERLCPDSAPVEGSPCHETPLSSVVRCGGHHRLVRGGRCCCRGHRCRTRGG